MPISVKRPLNSLYIHIPFCKEKCYYCSFISLVDKNNCKDVYINALSKEISTVLETYRGINLNSIYIGGGTPSLLKLQQIENIIKSIYKYSKINDLTEITIEVNPGTVDFSYLKGLKELGINRLSIGIQSFNDEILKRINRIHNAEEAVITVETARKAGFDNISIDIIHGLPGQTMEIWKNTLNQALKLDIEHISTYGLKIEEGTVFGKKPPQNLPDEELGSQMYIKTAEILEENNFIHYEISNYAKAGHESKHNLAYWKNEEYFGFGLSAHGYINGYRYSNTAKLNDYIENSVTRAETHQVSFKEEIEEAIFLGLRLMEGINLDKFRQEYGFDLYKEFRQVIDKYMNYEFMQIKEGYLRLTLNGILVSNSILADFLS